jgi:hypothetical protein
MIRGLLADQGYKPHFTGHSTFPLRYGWLKKAFDAVHKVDNKRNNKSKIFLDESSIANFGVGKNMVEAIRHWAQVTDVIEEGTEENSLRTTVFGRALFEDTGLDPYLENPSSLWLIHWKLCSAAKKTTWHWAFNYYTSSTFEREQLVSGLVKLAADAGWPRVSPNTIKRDVDCFVRTYVARPIKNKEAHEDSLECPLAELGAIRSVGARDGFRFVHGLKPSLGNGAFLSALVEFWGEYSPAATTLSFEALMHEPGSPGRVFLLDENDIADRLILLEDLTHGRIRWSETAGMKQVVREAELTEVNPVECLRVDYLPSEKQRAAE